MKSGFSDDEIRATIDKYKGTELESVRKELLAFQNKMLDRLYEGDLIGKEQHKALLDKWENYMPLTRYFDDDKIEFAKGLSESFSNVSNNLQALKGSDRKTLDPIESMLGNIYKTTSSINRNKVGVRLAELAKRDVDEKFIKEVKKSDNLNRKNVVSVKIKGEEKLFEVEPEVFKAFNNLDKEGSNALMKILSKPASLLRAGATLTPEFATRNPIRDIQAAFINSESGFNLADAVVGLFDTVKKGEYYQGFMRESGGFGNITSADQHAKTLKKLLTKTPGEKFVNVINPAEWVELMRRISDVTETGTKVGEFRKALKKGATPQEAAFRAKNLMDFSRSGVSVKEANRVVAFLNAGIQGKARLIKSIKDRPVKTMARIATATILPTIGVRGINSQFANKEQKQKIDDAPDWMKATFWLVAVPGTDLVARIPKSFETAAVANFTERTMEWMEKNDPKAYEGFVKETLATQAPPVMLTGLQPFLEGAANYSYFRQGPIIPRREEFLKPEDQFDSKTSEVSKAGASVARAIFGEETKFGSPRIVDYMLKSSTGGLGSTTLDAIDYLLDSTGIADKPVKAKKDITQLPLAKGWLVNSASSGQSLGDLYDLKNKLQKEKGSAKLKGTEWADKALLTMVNRVTSEISQISKKMREITESTTLSAEEKKTQLDEFNKMRNNKAKEAMELIKKNK